MDRALLKGALEPRIRALFPPVPDNVFAASTDRSWGERQGICFNGFWSNNYDNLANRYEYSVLTNQSPEGSVDPICILTHEFGHQIDYILTAQGLRDEIDQLWDEAVMKYNIDNDYFTNNLCSYAGQDSMEFLAEGFTEYIHNPNPRALAAKIGKAIDNALS